MLHTVKKELSGDEEATQQKRLNLRVVLFYNYFVKTNLFTCRAIQDFNFFSCVTFFVTYCRSRDISWNFSHVTLFSWQRSSIVSGETYVTWKKSSFNSHTIVWIINPLFCGGDELMHFTPPRVYIWPWSYSRHNSGEWMRK